MDYIQYSNFALAIIVIILRGYLIYKKRSKPFLSVPELVLMVHFVIFFLLKGCFAPVIVNLWSSSIRLQSIVTFLLLDVYNLMEGKHERDGQGRCK